MSQKKSIGILIAIALPLIAAVALFQNCSDNSLPNNSASSAASNAGGSASGTAGGSAAATEVQIDRYASPAPDDMYAVAGTPAVDSTYSVAPNSFWLYAAPDSNSIPLYSCNASEHILTKHGDCEGYPPATLLGYTHDSQMNANETMLYRFVSTSGNLYHYETTNYLEGANLPNMRFEQGLGYVVMPTAANATAALPAGAMPLAAVGTTEIQISSYVPNNGGMSDLVYYPASAQPLFGEALSNANAVWLYAQADVYGTAAIYECAVTSFWGAGDHLISVDPGCEGAGTPRLLGFVHQAQLGPNEVPIYRFVTTSGHQFHAVSLSSTPPAGFVLDVNATSVDTPSTGAIPGVLGWAVNPSAGNAAAAVPTGLNN